MFKFKVSLVIGNSIGDRAGLNFFQVQRFWRLTLKNTYLAKERESDDLNSKTGK